MNLRKKLIPNDRVLKINQGYFAEGRNWNQTSKEQADRMNIKKAQEMKHRLSKFGHEVEIERALK